MVAKVWRGSPRFVRTYESLGMTCRRCDIWQGMCRSRGGQRRVLVRGRSGGATAALVGRSGGGHTVAPSYVREGGDGSRCRDGCLRYIQKRIGGPLSSVGWVRLLTWVDRHVPWERERESMSAGSARPGAYGGVSRCDGQM